ncbi:unnamed protein product [Psylliodes chrysocephalus]|uniref:Uncharacterized protein n=1 Tax=Psylliodes chrysocephalus TaxID=3402493 RepID=A0A9P0D6X6_9CUCU|nr:unnamed protein product [Psylliodes chrysocephala]
MAADLRKLCPEYFPGLGNFKNLAMSFSIWANPQKKLQNAGEKCKKRLHLTKSVIDGIYFGNLTYSSKALRYIYCVSQELGVQDENGKFVIDTLRNVMNIYPIFGKDVDHMIDECLYNRLDGYVNMFMGFVWAASLDIESLKHRQELLCHSFVAMDLLAWLHRVDSVCIFNKIDKHLKCFRNSKELNFPFGNLILSYFLFFQQNPW